MRKVMKSIMAVVLGISLLIQTACWDQKLYEKIGFILQLGLELDEDGTLLVSMTSPVVAPETREKVELLHSSSQRLIRASREGLRNIAGKELQTGEVQHIYFSKEIAQKGIGEFLGVFFRDAENPLLANVIVVEGSPKEMMEFSIKYEDKPRTAFYVNELLTDAHRRAVAPEARIYNFSILHHSKTIDPVVPFLRYNKKNIEVAGSALFSGDQLVGEINVDQTVLLNMLMDKKERGIYLYEEQVPNQSEQKIKRGAVLSIKSAKRKIKIDTSGKVPRIHIKLQLKAFLDEYSGEHNLNEAEKKKKFEDAIARSIQADSLELLKYLQKVGADPIGLGEIVRIKQNKYWKSVEWKEVYKDAIFNVEVKMNLESYGTIQ